MQPLAVPVLPGPTVTLRAHTPQDLDGVHERSADPVSQAFTTIPLEYTREMAEEYIAGLLEPSAEQISWAIECEGRYAGTIDLRVLPVEGGGGGVGYVTHPAFRGRGVMSEALGLTLGHAFDTLGWRFVRWQAHAGNWASAKAVWRNGFPLPVFVPDLLVERRLVVDGWMSTVWAEMPRTATRPWSDWQAALGGVHSSQGGVSSIFE